MNSSSAKVSSSERPEAFVPTLRDNPRDRGARTAALAWYSVYDNNSTQLRIHTRYMAEVYPDHPDIAFSNYCEFRDDESYRQEIERLLEQHVDAYRSNHLFLFTLARVKEYGLTKRMRDGAIGNRTLQAVLVQRCNAAIDLYRRASAAAYGLGHLERIYLGFTLELKKIRTSIAGETERCSE